MPTNTIKIKVRKQKPVILLRTFIWGFRIKSGMTLVFLLLFKVSLQELLLNIARYRLIVSEFHLEGSAT